MAHIKIQKRLRLNVIQKAFSIRLQLVKSKSCISKETKKNSINRKYYHYSIQEQVDIYDISTKKNSLTKNNSTIVRLLLQQKWSRQKTSDWLNSTPSSRYTALINVSSKKSG